MFFIGRWQSTSAQIVDSAKPIEYKEQLQFSFTGQPLLTYRARSWNPSTKAPMHFESGFLRIKPTTNELSLVTAHNFGVTIVEEGTVNGGNEIVLKSTKLGRMSFAKPPEVLQINRTYTFDEQTSELKLATDMATSTNPLRRHLNAVYKRVSN